MPSLRIVTPCDEDWTAMAGGPAVRHCPRCDRSVHRLAAMPRVEVDRLLASLAQARVCLRAPVRADGTLHVTSADDLPTLEPDDGEALELGGEPCMDNDDVPYSVELPDEADKPSLPPGLLDDLLDDLLGGEDPPH